MTAWWVVARPFVFVKKVTMAMFYSGDNCKTCAFRFNQQSARPDAIAVYARRCTLPSHYGRGDETLLIQVRRSMPTTSDEQTQHVSRCNCVRNERAVTAHGVGAGDANPQQDDVARAESQWVLQLLWSDDRAVRCCWCWLQGSRPCKSVPTSSAIRTCVMLTAG